MAHGEKSPAGPFFGRIVLWWRVLRATPAFRFSSVFARRLTGKPLVISIPYLWLLLFFVIPFIIVLKISFAEFERHAASVFPDPYTAQSVSQ